MPGMKKRLRDQSEKLTRREIEVLYWVAQGRSASEIGRILGISERTVEVHVSRAIRKLGARNRTHAAIIALREGLIDW